MTEKYGKSAGRNFAPMPLFVLASEAPMRAKLLILALFHHDWDGEKAWPSQERLAQIMSCSRDTVSEATKDCVKEGWITSTRRFADSNIYRMNIPGMTVQEFNAKIAGRLSEIPTKADSGIDCRESPHQLSEIPTIDAGNPGTNKNQVVRTTEAEPFPKADEKKLEKKIQHKSGDQTPGQKKLLEIHQSKSGKKFREEYSQSTQMTYVFSDEDVHAYGKLQQMGLSDLQVISSLGAFFDKSSYHRTHGFFSFKHWVNQAQRYALAGSPMEDATADARSRYYEPWDPRHPFFKPNDPIKIQQQQNWEASNGPWKPKADWAPGKER